MIFCLEIESCSAGLVRLLDYINRVNQCQITAVKVVDLTNQKYVTALAQISNGNSSVGVNATHPIGRAIKLWALGDLSLFQTIPSYHLNAINSLGISRHKKQITSASNDRTINIWRIVF